MQIIYQGKPRTTGTATSPALTVGDFLAREGISAGACVIECDGEILQAGQAAATPLREGMKLNVFRIVPGG